ncbi:MAG: molecular chaperone DnaJ [Planctomycetota bacterium]
MPTTRDYYEVLGVEKTADADEIKRSYRRLAMKYHPDRNQGDAEAEAKFKDAAEAYEVLSDDAKRQRYDQFGHDGLRGGGGAATHDFSRMDVSDIFSMFDEVFGGGGFGGMGGGGRTARGRGGQRVARGYDLETEVRVSMAEVATGCEREVEFKRMDVCQTCSGSGAKPGTSPVTCPTCNGSGKVQQQGLGGMFRMVTACPTCRGRGTIIKEVCEDCRGKGRVPKARRLSVKIPAGIHDGQAVRVQGEGEPPPQEISPSGEGVRGDLHVVIRVDEHELFERDGDNLLLRMPISYTQAALGAEVEVPTLDGTKPLNIPKGTQYGAIFKINDAGLPNLRSGRRGDLVVVTQIETPTKLTADQERLLREFAETENEKVHPESHGFWSRIKDAFGG